MTPIATARREDIDALRIAATYLLFVFHTAMVFNPAPFYHIRNDELSFLMLIVCGFISLWHMPLFFLLAGWATHASLQRRGRAGYVRERISKLFIPLIAGIILFGPAIKFLELRSGLDLSHTGLRVAPALQESFRVLIPSGLDVAPPFNETFLEFLPTFFTSLDRFSWSHLWFVAYLFTFSLVFVPLLPWLARWAGTLTTERAWLVYLPIVPLALIQLTLRERWPGIQNLYNDWANVAYYTVYFLAGFVAAAQPRLERAAHAEGRRALLIALAATVVLLLAVLKVFTATWVVLAGSGVAGWCLNIAIIGLGERLRRTWGKALPYLRDSAFSVYILHQAAIVVPGYFLIQLPLGVPAKFLLVLTVAVLSALALYHFVVRSWEPVAFLFGTQVRRPPSRVVVPAAATMLVLWILTIPSARGSNSVSATPPLGRWYAEGGSAQVEIRPCEDQLCGRVVWLRSPWDEFGCELRDRYNPDTTLQDRPVLGLDILSGLAKAPDEDGVWRGGAIYDPSSGRTYSCQAELAGPDRLELRGYYGIPLLGRTTRWFRVGTEAHMCRTAQTTTTPAQENRP
jgi:glucans biosynthesis protein C